MKVVIKKVNITGFKGYKDAAEVVLGDVRTLISGENGKGKSSIGEAICWTFTGCDIYGNEKATTRLVNDSKPKLTEVELQCLIDGNETSIIRRKKGAAADVYINDRKASNSEVAEIYKSKDIFLSIFNPYYFPSLSPKDAKSLLSDVLKPIPKEKVFEELGEYFTEILKRNNFKIPETFITDKNSEIKEHKDNIVFIEGLISGLKIQEVAEKLEFDPTELRLLMNRAEKLKTVSTSTALAELEKKKFELELKIKQGPTLKALTSIENLEYKRTDLLKRYKTLKDKHDNFEVKSDNCPSCGFTLKDNFEAKEVMAKDLAVILAEGTDIKVKIEEAKKNNDEIKLENEKISQEFYEVNNSELSDIIEKITLIKKEAAAETEKNQAELLELNQKIKQLQEKEKEVIKVNAEIDLIIKKNAEATKELKSSEERIQNSKNKIEEIKLAIDAGKQYNSIRLNKQTSTINQYLDKVELSFEELSKDGELKEKFKILYENKEFNKLSNSEKIRAGLEISNLISSVMDIKLPVFVDDSESIIKVPELDTQMILTKVVEGIENIKVEAIEYAKIDR